jgi:ABC-type phosphate/phosphonate transport system substrate-binding protein
VVPRGLDAGLKERLRAAFLEAHTDARGAELLRKMKIDRFVRIEDGAYDSVREMQAWIAASRKAGG